MDIVLTVFEPMGVVRCTIWPWLVFGALRTAGEAENRQDREGR